MKNLFLIVLLIFVYSTPSFAGLGDELKRWKDDVGDVLEEARDEIKEKAEEAIKRAEDVARKVKAESKRLEKRIRKLRDELKGELAKLGDVGKALNKTIEVTEVAIEESGVIIEKNIEKIEVIKTVVVEKKLDPYEIVIESSSTVLGEKIATAISGDKINELLEKEILGDIKIIDVLIPIKSGLERLDPTGMQECIRRGVVKKAGDSGSAILAGAPDVIISSGGDNVALEAAATTVVSNCLQKYVKRPEPGASGPSPEEITQAESERDAAINELNENEEQSAEAEKHYAELKKKYALYSGILEDTTVLAEEAEKLKLANLELSKELDEKLKEAGINPDEFTGEIQ